MKSLRIVILMIMFAGFFTACTSTKEIPNPEVRVNTGGDMGGGTGTGLVGDDPTMPEEVVK